MQASLGVDVNFHGDVHSSIIFSAILSSNIDTSRFFVVTKTLFEKNEIFFYILSFHIEKSCKAL